MLPDILQVANGHSIVIFQYKIHTAIPKKKSCNSLSIFFQGSKIKHVSQFLIFFFIVINPNDREFVKQNVIQLYY